MGDLFGDYRALVLKRAYLIFDQVTPCLQTLDLSLPTGKQASVETDERLILHLRIATVADAMLGLI